MPNSRKVVTQDPQYSFNCALIYIELQNSYNTQADYFQPYCACVVIIGKSVEKC